VCRGLSTQRCVLIAVAIFSAVIVPGVTFSVLFSLDVHLTGFQGQKFLDALWWSQWSFPVLLGWQLTGALVGLSVLYLGRWQATGISSPSSELAL
jgi:hypothetical protein